MTNAELIKKMASWEQERRSLNRDKAKADKTPAISQLGSRELTEAIKTGHLPYVGELEKYQAVA